MATYPIKMLKDEENKPFVPLVSTDCIRDENNQTLQQVLDKKLSPTNLLPGEYVSITTEGNNCYVNVDLPANLNVINNLTTTSAGQGALDAYQGKVLKDSIPQVVNDLSSTSTTSALSANQGYILNNKINSLVVNTLDSLSTTNALSAAQGALLENKRMAHFTEIRSTETKTAKNLTNGYNSGNYMGHTLVNAYGNGNNMSEFYGGIYIPQIEKYYMLIVELNCGGHTSGSSSQFSGGIVLFQGLMGIVDKQYDDGWGNFVLAPKTDNYWKDVITKVMYVGNRTGEYVIGSVWNTYNGSDFEWNAGFGEGGSTLRVVGFLR